MNGTSFVLPLTPHEVVLTPKFPRLRIAFICAPNSQNTNNYKSIKMKNKVAMDLYIYEVKNREEKDEYMKRKKAVGGRLGMFGSFSFFSFLPFFAFGSDDTAFFLSSI